MLIEDGRARPDDAPLLFASGEEAAGEFHCADCGYGITVRSVLPLCPMCGAGAWEPPHSSPFARGHGELFH
jgi:rubrerythrin